MTTESFTVEELDELRSTTQSALAKSTDLEATLELLGADDLVEEGGIALGILFEELGRVAAPSALLDRVVRHALGLDPADGPSVVYPLPVPGGAPVSAAVSSPAGLSVVGLLAGEPGDELLVADDSGAVSVVEAASAGLAVDRVAGLEPRAGWLRVTGTVDATAAVRTEITARWTDVVPLARRALAAQLVGTSREMLRIAVDHVTTREQFGRALGSFQAVRHRLAETLVELNAAEAALALSWATEGSDDENDVSIAAKASAGRAFESAAKNCVQVCGAMGLTFEHPLHFLVRFGTVRNALLGDPRSLAAEIGRRILAGERLAQFDPLVDER